MKSSTNFPIIFLDIDGVLNNNASISEGVCIIPEKVILVRELCYRTNAKIVISSTWRKIFKKKDLSYWLAMLGLRDPKLIIDYTDQDGPIRGHEIRRWLEEHPGVTKYVILDDDIDMLEGQFFVKTRMETGLTNKQVLDAEILLKSDVGKIL